MIQSFPLRSENGDPSCRRYPFVSSLPDFPGQMDLIIIRRLHDPSALIPSRFDMSFHTL